MKAFGKTKIAILETLAALQRKYGKSYCFPTQYRLLELLKDHHKIILSRRALNYALREIEDAGLINRKRRIRKGPQGLIFNSTLYFFQKAGYVFLNKIKRFGELIDAVFRGNKLRRNLAAAPRISTAGPVGIGEIFKNLIPI